MTTLSIPLPDALLQQLNERAHELRIAPEVLVRASIEELLARPRDEFQRALNHVLEKNAELYRHLA